MEYSQILNPADLNPARITKADKELAIQNCILKT